MVSIKLGTRCFNLIKVWWTIFYNKFWFGSIFHFCHTRVIIQFIINNFLSVYEQATCERLLTELTIDIIEVICLVFLFTFYKTVEIINCDPF